MKIFDKMKTNEREMILSMLANNAERNIELLVEQAFDEGNEFTLTDVLDLADYLGNRWGIDFRTICFNEAVNYQIQTEINGWKA